MGTNRRIVDEDVDAAIRPHKPFTEVTLQDWEEVRGVVLDGASIVPSRH